MNPTESPDSAGQTVPTKKNGLAVSIAKWLLITFLTLILIVVAVLSIGPSIHLAPYRQDINHWLTNTLKRPTAINGDMTLTLSWSPEVLLGDIEIADTDPNAYMPFFSAAKIAAKVEIAPLFENTLSIKHLDLKNIQLNPQIDPEGKPNWMLAGMNDKQEDKTPDSSNESPAMKIKLSDSISAEQISLSYLDQTSYQGFDWQLESLSLTKPDNWLLETQGSVMGEMYQLVLKGELEKLLNEQTGKLDIQGQFAGAELNIDANIIPPSKGTSTASLDFNWLDTTALEYHLGLDAKYAAPMAMKASLKASEKGFSISDLTINSPVTHGDGFLDVKLAQTPDDINLISGRLNIPLVDLRPWLQPEEVPEMVGYANAAPQKSPLQMALEQWLEKTSTDVKLGIGEIKGLGTNVSNISLNIEGKQGKLTAPMTADIADVPFRGHANIDATDWTSTVDIRLGAKDSQLGEMAGWITGIPNAHGSLKKAELAVTTEGTKLKEWIDNSTLNLEVDSADVDWGSKATFAISKAELKAGMLLPFQSDIRGQLMGIPVTVSAKAGTLEDILQKRDWQTQIQFNSPVLHVDASGMLAGTEWQPGSWFNLNITSKDASKLSPWLGTHASISGAIDLKGKLNYRPGAIAFDLPSLKLMNTVGTANIVWHQDTPSPLLEFTSHFTRLDFTQFGQFVNDDELPQVEQTAPTQGVNLDVPLLPDSIVIADANLDLKVDEMRWGEQSLDNLSFKGKVRRGQLSKAPFSASYAGSQYKGDISLGLSDQKISAGLNLSVNEPNIGAVLQQLNLADNLKMQLRSASLALSLSGRTVLELMEQAKVDTRFNGGVLKVADIYTGKAIDVYLNSGSFVTGPDTATHLKMTGTASGLPVEVTLDSLSLRQANDGRSKVPLTMAVSLGDTHFTARSDVVVPLDLKTMTVKVAADTPSLDRFNRFTGADLPPYGPINLSASMTMDEVGYRLQDLIVSVGSSKLTGHGNVIPPQATNQLTRPKLELAFSAPFIQLDDFNIPHWSAWIPEKKTSEAEGKKAETKAGVTSDITDKKASGDAKDKPIPVVSPEGLLIADANFKLDVNEVRSGKDWLGAGKLYWTLKDGLLTLSPLNVQIPGGLIHVEGDIAAKGKMFDINLKGNVKNFDYGVIARHIDPETEMYGTLSTRFTLKSLANNPDSLMQNATGFVGFSAWPKAFDAHLIDLWAVSLTDAIIPNFTDNDPSQLNCVAAGLDIDHGKMKQREMIMDTSRIHVIGDFSANYKDRAFDLSLTPLSKHAQIFGLQTPVSINGKFEDFSLSVPWTEILKTTVRFTTSPVVTPLRWLFEEPLPKDASAECERIWQGSPVS
ncbi:AsmA family protein [Veronia pacifica]|uniref:AsmA protein n=1 Tax=Veronia pacifica TaxID=1080227 RepID=A0A1C3EE02_9GAMM|nr:AsmA family protein [Veronia pacifica]ODA31455.1 AsmA protein [Veronia pacifica]